MSIMWNYLDKRRATIAALKDYDAMQFIIESYQDDVKTAQEKMVGVSSPRYDVILSDGPHANPIEHRLLNGLSKVEKINERYHSAQEYLHWFEPSWNKLSEDERWILNVFYQQRQGQTRAIQAIKDRYCIERSSAYNKKNRALDHLTLLLYGGH